MVRFYRSTANNGNRQQVVRQSLLIIGIIPPQIIHDHPADFNRIDDSCMPVDLNQFGNSTTQGPHQVAHIHMDLPCHRSFPGT